MKKGPKGLPKNRYVPEIAAICGLHFCLDATRTATPPHPADSKPDRCSDRSLEVEMGPGDKGSRCNPLAGQIDESYPQVRRCGIAFNFDWD
jgi:hypothetical protein